MTGAEHPWPGRRYRLARLIALFFGLGLLSAVLVSWVLTLEPWPSKAPPHFATIVTESGVRVTIGRRDSPGVLSLSAVISGPAIPQNLRISVEEAVPWWARHELLGWAHADPPPRGPDTGAFMLVSGWPFPCMWTTFNQRTVADSWSWYQARNGIVLGPAPPNPNFYGAFSPRERVLPTHVAWPAFIGCTLFWATLWASLFLAPPALRRTIRRRRGQCAACGYDRTSLATTARCPECGHVP